MRPEHGGRRMEAGGYVFWEARDPDSPALGEARRVYEATLDAAERIPWAWVASAASRRGRRRDGWSPHLLLAAPRAGGVAGFAYGIHLAGYGGYACYLGVDPGHRGRGVGTRLLAMLIDVLKQAAAAEGEALPFVVWESRAPNPGAGEDERALWRARLGLFERVGAWRVAGLTFFAPSFVGRSQAVPLQLFLVPAGASPADFDAPALREVAAGLMRNVYGRDEGDRLFDRTLASATRPSLRPVADPAAL